ncbi:hypothetical protein GBAR_LOCUS11373 [Geodia barretti]|uniref:Uncharacterized protein n=1 Tax=Geodia barretti TaxID=519541 RepID=A0AA35WLX6_GEOBA|nr:hypothetical protein GBAR_LOCUS11373 [Geodia barretti]
MKLIVTVVLCTMVIILQQTAAQDYCSAPECSSGANLDPYACNCVNFTKSTCPNDTSEIVDSYGRCSCQAAVHPECDAGYTLNPDACICKIRVPPTCPNGTYLTPRNAQCIGIDEPTCPEGFSKVGCKCIKEVGRQCQNGELAANDCKCKNVYPPRCSGRGCSLNNTNGECTCERDDPHQIQCYYSRRCGGQTYYVSDIAECCYRWPEDYDGDDSQSPPHTRQYLKYYYSYRSQYDRCYPCAYYHYYRG